jgi:hypothetical protein
MNVAAGASITLQSGSQLEVTGNLVNNGTLSGSGVLMLDGTSSQAIMGVGVVGNVTLNNGSGAYINSSTDSMTLTGALSLQSGNFNTNNNLVIYMSDDPIGGPAVNGRIAPITGGSISGQAIIQQYIRGNRRAYRFWSTPFYDSVPLSQLENYMDITGPYGSIRGFTTTAANTPSAFWYDTKHSNSSVTGGSGDPGWIPFTWCKDSMSAGVQVSADSNMVHRFEGYRLFFRGSKGEGLGSGAYVIDPVTVRQWGHLNTGDQYIHLQKGALTVSGAYVQDYNQKGNPYAAPVDVGSVVYNAWVDSMLVQPYIWVWNPYGGAAGVFQRIDETGTSASPYYISANTSFQVRAKYDGAIIHFAESNKSTGPTSDLLKQSSGQDLTLIVVDSSGHFWDRLDVNFTDLATENEDNIDAGKPVNPGFNFYSWSADHHPLGRDLRPYEAGKVIPLGVTSDFRMPYTIRVDNYAAPTGSRLYLHDKLLGTYVMLSQGSDYKFAITDDPQSQGDNRFEIGLDRTEQRLSGTSGALNMMLMPNPATNAVNLTFINPDQEQLVLRIVTLEGICLENKVLGNAVRGDLNIALDRWTPGLYLVELSTGKGTIMQRLIKE